MHWVRALTVPMHLDLIDWPFVPYNLISAQDSPVSLPKFQMTPRLKILIFSESKKGAQICYPFLSKSPGKRIHSRFPNGAPMEREIPAYRLFLHLSWCIFLIYLSGSPVKEHSLQVLLMVSPRRKMPRSKSLHTFIIQNPGIWATLLIPGSPQTWRSPYGERYPYPGPFLTYLPGSPVKESSSVSLFREKRSILRTSFIHLSKSLVDESPWMFPSGVPMEQISPSDVILTEGSAVSDLHKPKGCNLDSDSRENTKSHRGWDSTVPLFFDLPEDRDSNNTAKLWYLLFSAINQIDAQNVVLQ